MGGESFFIKTNFLSPFFPRGAKPNPHPGVFGEKVGGGIFGGKPGNLEGEGVVVGIFGGFGVGGGSGDHVGFLGRVWVRMGLGLVVVVGGSLGGFGGLPGVGSFPGGKIFPVPPPKNPPGKTKKKKRGTIKTNPPRQNINLLNFSLF